MVNNSQELFSTEDTKIAADVAGVVTSRGLSLSQLVDLCDTDSPSDPHQLELGEQSQPKYGENVITRDSQFPLPIGDDEDFVLRVVDGEKPGQAYKSAYSSRATYASCKQQASRRLGESDISERLRWLIADKNRKRRIEEQGGSEARLTTDEKIILLEAVIKDRNGNWSDRVAAMKEHTKLVQEASGNEPKSLQDMDPVEIMDYFNRCAKQGLDPVQVATELQKKEEERVRRQIASIAPPAAKEPVLVAPGPTIGDGGAQPVVVDGVSR